MFRFRSAFTAISGLSSAIVFPTLARAEDGQVALNMNNPSSGNWSKHKAYYWYNRATGETSWAEPDGYNCRDNLCSQDSSNKWDKRWDKMDTDTGVDSTKAVHHIVLIRHGQYCEGNDDDVDRLLTDKGISQSLATGQRLRDLIEAGKIPRVEKFRYSTMVRASQTADLVLSKLQPMNEPGRVQPCSMIREGACIVPEPNISKEQWDVTETDFHRDGLRIEAAFRNYIHRAPADAKSSFTTVLVCHGNVIRYLVTRALQQDPAGWLRLSVANGSMTLISVYPTGKVSLTNLGDVGHFQSDLITYN